MIVTSPPGCATGTAGCAAVARGGSGAAASTRAAAKSWSASARCSGGSCCSLMNLMIRLIRMPSLMNPPSSARSGAGTLAWCSATASHWSLNTSEPEEPGSVSAA